MASYLDKTGLATLWKKIKLAPYPVGSIYMSMDSTSPASLFGGTWERLESRFLLAADGTYAAGSTGGESTHTLTVNEMPNHSHGSINVDGAYVLGWGNGSSKGFDIFKQNYSDSVNNKWVTSAQGGSQAHNNMPPYLAVYMWKRTA